MVKVPLFNQKGEKIKEEQLPSEIFDVRINSDVLYQVVTSQMANRRQGTAHTKDRSEVKGGGRKPWPQKGTGRARHGSIRSPIWRGGGVTFGPRNEKIYKKKINKKMRRKALFMALTAKVKNELMILLDKLNINQPKTKLVKEVLEKLPCKSGSCLIVLPELDKNIILGARNLPKVSTIQARELNALDVLNFKYIVMPQKSVQVIKETFLK